MNQNSIQICVVDPSDSKFLASAIRVLQTLQGDQLPETKTCTGSCHATEVVSVGSGCAPAVVAETAPAAPAHQIADRALDAIAAAPVAPAAPVVPAAPAAPAAPVAAGVEVDSAGTPWAEDIHSSTKVKNADGTWRVRRNVEKEVVARRSAELRAQLNGGAAPLAQAPAAPAAPVVPPAPAPIVPTVPAIPVPPVPTVPSAAAPSVPVPPAPSTAVQSASSVPVPPAPVAGTAPAGNSDLKQHLSAFTRLVIAISKQQIQPEAVIARAADFGLIVTAPVELREADVSLVEGIAASFGI